MKSARLEAFTDGVVAIIITIMVLELKVPDHGDLASLKDSVPVLFAYALSFINVGLYWNNHHHLFQATDRIDGTVLWTNLFLLFWLSLMPFVIRWLGAASFTPGPTAAYGFVLFMASLGWMMTERALLRCNGTESRLARALGSDWKGRLSLLLYFIGMLLAFANAWLAIAVYICTSAMWFIPDRRIERVLND